MSASCLEVRSQISAPPPLDSDRMDPACEATPGNCADSAGEYRALPGGLGLALEEELAVLAGQRDQEPDQAAAGTAESGEDPDLLTLFRQKEKDLVLAAKLGKALLERNQDLTQQYDTMTRGLHDQLELLEQEKHELRRRLERREGEWEERLSELETDLRLLQDELEKQQLQVKEAERDKSRVISQLSEQNHRLLEQLSRATEVEKQLSTQVLSLQDDFREKSISSNQHTTRLETLQVEQGLEIQLLSECKRDLELRVNDVMEENQHLHGTVGELRERAMMLERQCEERDMQLRQARLELQEERESRQRLNTRTEETHGVSLQREMEQEELEEEREQLRLQLWETYCQVRSLCSHLRGNDITDSALSTDSSMDESSETLSVKDVPVASLSAGLLELRRLTQNLLDGDESLGSPRSDEEVLEEQLGEELRELRQMCEEQQKKAQHSQEEALQLQSQVALLSAELSAARLKVLTPDEQLQSAIRDRDEAITKKRAVEAELATCKSDIISLNTQLLDAIQQKLNLSQQLEAWQDDMHRVIDQQLMDKQQEEWKERRPGRPRPLASFFKRS